MKVQQLAVGGFWEQQQQDSSSPSSSSSSSTSIASASLTINYFKRLRPLSPNLTATANDTTTASSATQTNTFLDLNGFHTPKTKCTAQNPDSAQVEMQPGGTRWNPAPEQIRVLEALYMSGMRTPNAHQIERITGELRKYGRIEGKNVFYWFQNHKARERQKQKRSALLALSGINHYNSASPPIMTLISSRANGGDGGEEADREECYDGSCKRNCRRWGCLGPDVEEAEGGGDRTLELFPLHPKGKQMR